MLLVDALKEVYKALGGSADDVANMSQNADVIAAIATKAGSGLPAVSATDNGDVLTVVEGAWAKAEPSGGDAVFIEATRTQTGKFSIPYTGDKFKELCESKVVYVIVRFDPNHPAWATALGLSVIDANEAHLSSAALISTNPVTVRHREISFNISGDTSPIEGTLTTNNIVSAS